MTTVLLVVHIMIATALCGIVLMQRSEGGALGMGGGGFMSGRGQANFLTRATAYLAMAFFATSITLTLIANRQNAPGSIFDTPVSGSTSTPAGPAPASAPSVPTPQPAPAAPARGGILDKLQQPGSGQAPLPK